MDMINKRFQELNLSKHQSLLRLARPKCETYMEKVFGNKRNHIDASDIEWEITSPFEWFQPKITSGPPAACGVHAAGRGAAVFAVLTRDMSENFTILVHLCASDMSYS